MKSKKSHDQKQLFVDVLHNRCFQKSRKIFQKTPVLGSLLYLDTCFAVNFTHFAKLLGTPFLKNISW